jgi:hypothetical protein
MAEAETTKRKIATHCDARCQYAVDVGGDCDCECGGKNHGQGTDTRIREAQAVRHSKTKRGFKEHYNNEHGERAAQKLYRRDRAEFNKLYAAYSGKEAPVEEITTVHQSGSEVTVIKDANFSGDIYSHVRRSNGKTEYRKNDKLITKAQVPEELGW